MPVDCCVEQGMANASAGELTHGQPSAWAGKRVAVLYRGHSTRSMKSTFDRTRPGLENQVCVTLPATHRPIGGGL